MPKTTLRKTQSRWIPHKRVDLVILLPLSLTYGPIAHIGANGKMRTWSPNQVHPSHPKMKMEPGMTGAQIPMSLSF